MLSNRCLPLAIFVVCLSAPANAREPDECQTAAFWLKQAAHYAELSGELDPEGHVLHELVYAQARAGELAKAAETASKITNVQLRVYGHCFVAKQYEEHGDTRACKSQLDEARQAAQKDTRKATSAFVTSRVVRAYFDHGYPADAESYVATIRDDYARRIAYRNVAAQYAQKGQMKRAFEIVAQQLTGNWQESALKQMADACTSARRLNDFRDVIARMNNQQYIDHCTATLVRELAGINRFEEAREFAAAMTAGPQRAQVELMIDANQPDVATVQGITERLKQASHRNEKLTLYRELFQLQNAAKDVAAAETTIEKMVRTVKASPRKAEMTKFGKSDDAGEIASIRALYLQTAKTLADQGKNDESMRHINKAEATIMDLSEETGLAKMMLVRQLVAAKIALGDLAGARQLLPRIEIDFTRASAARTLALAYIGEMNMAAAREATDFITAKRGRGLLIGEVAAAFVTAGQPFLAQELLATLEQTDDDGQAYRAVARAMVKQGQYAELLRSLEITPSPIACAYACIGAAEELRQP
jgi:hypothetical protein